MYATKNGSDDVGCDECKGADGEMKASETHAIALAEGSRLVVDSEGLGWTNLYAAITSERRWSGTIEPIAHLCLAYCLRRPATITRRIEGEEEAMVATLRPRHFGFVPTRVRSTFTLTGSADILMVYLRGAAVERAAERLFGASAAAFVLRPRIGVLDPLLEQLVLEIAAALHRRAPGDRVYIDELAMLAAGHLLRRHFDRPTPDTAARPEQPPRLALGAGLARVREYIEEGLDRDLGLAVLAREAGLRAGLFAEAFSQTFGTTPHQYVIRRRLERAKTLLIGTDLPLSEVALQTGFASQSHFSDVFRKDTGETPRSFRHAAGRCRG